MYFEICMTLKLTIGNKNYSSWSMRPWLAMKVANISFEEEVISLDADDFKSRLNALLGSSKVRFSFFYFVRLGRSR